MMSRSGVPRKLRDISVREARAMLQEHAERSPAICGCDRCIVLMGLLRDRGYRWGTDTTGLGRGERSDQAQTLAPAGAVSATEKPTPDTPSRGRSVAP